MTPAKMNKIESALRVALAFREAFNKQAIDNMMCFFDDDCIIETYYPAPNGLIIHGKQALSQHWQDFFHAHPEMHLDIEEVFGFGESCIMRWKQCWIDEMGKEVHLRGVDVFKTSNDLICEKYAYGKSGEIM